MDKPVGYTHRKIAMPIRPIDMTDEEEGHLRLKLAELINEGLDNVWRLEMQGYHFIPLDEFLEVPKEKELDNESIDKPNT